jgi:hypothetical protein
MDGVQTIDYAGYTGCLALTNAETRVVLGHHCGGRVLEYALQGENALSLDSGQNGWLPKPGEPPINPTGGRCDIGPEHVVPRRPTLWLGVWTPEIVGPRHARLTSADDPETGSRLIRDFALDAEGTRMSFTQTIVNVSDRVTQWCHWSRTFARHGGIGIVPLTRGTPYSRYPKGYVMYGPGPAINFRPDDPNVVCRGDFLVVQGAPQYPKLGFDSYAGWFGYLMPHDVLFVKRYATYPDRVYNEIAGLTLCIFYPAERPVCELEPIGPRQTLAPGEVAAFTEEWYLLPYRFPSPGSEIDPEDVARAVEAHTSPVEK